MKIPDVVVIAGQVVEIGMNISDVAPAPLILSLLLQLLTLLLPLLWMRLLGIGLSFMLLRMIAILSSSTTTTTATTGWGGGSAVDNAGKD